MERALLALAEQGPRAHGKRGDMKQKPKRDEKRAAPRRPPPDAAVPTGIGVAAIRGAMQSENERHEQITGGDERQTRRGEDPERRRAGGESPG